jgi:predicted PolB exonuclease-like 3'-5' exonuclease
MAATTHLVLDIETIPDAELYTPAQPSPGTERTFPPIFACKPVVIGVMWLDENLVCKKTGTIGEGKDEGGMLADFAEFMAKWKPTIVSWNGRGFDLPVLMLRSLRYGVSAPWYYQQPRLSLPLQQRRPPRPVRRTGRPRRHPHDLPARRRPA